MRKKHLSSYLSFTLKIAFSNISLTEKEAFQHPWPCILFICLFALTQHSVLRSSKLVILCIEALHDMLCKKALTHENLSSALQEHFISMRKKHLSCTLSFTLKIAFSNILSLRKNFSASVALHSPHLLCCTKHSISVLRSSKLVILCIEALTYISLQKSSNT